MKLYSGPCSLFTAKVRIALAEKGLAYERVEVGWSLTDRYEPHHPEVVARNPKRQVPVLVDGDTSVYDSTLILEYLEDRFPEPPLHPRDPVGRARSRQLEAEADEIVFPFVWDLIEESLYPAGASGRDDARLAAARSGLEQRYVALERQLAETPYLCGDFGIADIALFIMLATAATLGQPPGAKHPKLQAWLARVGDRPSVRADLLGMTAALSAARAAA